MSVLSCVCGLLPPPPPLIHPICLFTYAERPRPSTHPAAEVSPHTEDAPPGAATTTSSSPSVIPLRRSCCIRSGRSRTNTSIIDQHREHQKLPKGERSGINVDGAVSSIEYRPSTPPPPPPPPPRGGPSSAWVSPQSAAFRCPWAQRHYRATHIYLDKWLQGRIQVYSTGNSSVKTTWRYGMAGMDAVHASHADPRRVKEHIKGHPGPLRHHAS